MDRQVIELMGARLTALASGALWWEAESVLAVADLHLGKSERMARRGGSLLPPYETVETLDRLAAEITRLDPARVVCLGDSFDDAHCVDALGKAVLDHLTSLAAGRDWVWIAGNHDPGPIGLAGDHLARLRAGALTFRHEAEIGADPGEVSGHYHPKLRLARGGRCLTRSCFVHDAVRLILPAFGAYTGGLWTDDPALAGLVGPDACAILTGTPCVRVPLNPRRRRRTA